MKFLPFISLSLASSMLAGHAGATSIAAPTLSVSVTNEEAIGPFASWGNVKTKYGAVGDGMADDTQALQNALDDMNKRSTENPNKWNLEKLGSPAVLYFPAGTYRITRALVSKNQYGASMVGEDPANTAIAWDGAAGGTMLIADGAYGGRYARLTWNGKSKDGTRMAGIGVAHWWNKKTPQFGSSPEHVDEVFVDMGVGIVAGCCGASSTPISHPGTDWLASEYGNLDSEGSVKRTKFIRNTVAGVSTESGNALDWWVMDSEFTDCYRGVTNALGAGQGAGNILTYRNLFQRSTFADVHISHAQWQSMHGNVSIGSNRFLHATEAGSNGRSLILKNNRIVNPINKTPIYLGNVGPLIMIDNEILSPENAAGPLVQQLNYRGTPGADIILVGNRVTVPSQLSNLFSGNTPATVGTDPVMPNPEPNRLALYDTSTVRRSDISAEPPQLPGTAVNMARAVFEVPVTISTVTQANVTTSAMIQAVIDAAANSTDANPVVHFGRATYAIDTTLVIPAGRRIQLAGDGFATLLQPGPNLGKGPLLRMHGPSRATVRDMRLFSTNYGVTAVVLENADQPGGRILFEGGMNGVVKLSQLASTKVEFQRNTGVKKLYANAAAGVLAVGTGGTGPVSVNANSNVVMLDSWYEGTQSDPIISGNSGNFSYLGGHIAPPDIDSSGNAAGASVVVDNFAGRFTLMGTSFQMKAADQGIVVKNELADTKALFMGVAANGVFPESYYQRQDNPGAGTVGFAMMKVNGIHPAPDNGATDKAAVLAGLSQLRSQAWDHAPALIPAGATDVLFYRVRTVETAVGYDISGQ